MPLSLLLKLLILPFYLLLPFTMNWSLSLWPWLLPFMIWFVLIVVNAMAEVLRSRR